ncbi:MAG: aminopeptidase P family N-terminal domain-containing protein, partial [Pseudomonadota bacterium]
MPSQTPAFAQAEYDARLAKTRAAMEAAGIELLIVSDPSNMAWLTGYDGWSFYVHQCVVLGLSDPPLWYGRMQDTEGAYRTVWMADDRVLGYPDTYVQNPSAHPMAYLAEQLSAAHGTARIGVEMDNYWFTAK